MSWLTSSEAVAKTLDSSAGRLCDALHLTGATQVVGTRQAKRHVSPCPQLVYCPARPGAGDAAMEDAVVIHAQQFPRTEHEPRRDPSCAFRDLGPGGEVLTVAGL